MRLLEAMVDANHRALAGDTQAGLHPADYESELPLVALTCIDPRLNALLPQALGVPPEQFIWLRNAGNILTSSTSSTMRSLALACAVKGGKEIVIIGHSDCQVAKTGTMQLLDRLRALGIERHVLPENINEYFGIFSSERQNVIKGAELVRSSPLIGPKVPVHGLLIDIETGKLEWLVNGYQTLQMASSQWEQVVRSAGQTVDALKSFAEFKMGEIKFPEGKIGEIVTQAEHWAANKAQEMIAPQTPQAPPSAPAVPPKIPMPPPLRPKLSFRKGSK
jgi:carbonic anhydrase